MAEVLKQPTSWGCPITGNESDVSLTEYITTPSRICGFLLDLMRLKFSNPDNLYHERLRIYTYDKDPLKTHIKIEPGFDYLDQNNLADLHPGITVDVAETSVLDIGNAADQSTLGFSDGVFLKEHNMTAYGGSAVINAISSQPLESLLLAEDIFIWLLLFQYSICNDLQLSKFSVNLLKGPVKPETQGKTYYVSSVQIIWSAAFTYSINNVAPSLSDGVIV